MKYHLNFKVNSRIYLRDPESSELGRAIVKTSIDLIYVLGFEQFTFKKLATELKSTEATVYRYFENKHRLLLYILNWYWSYMEYLLEIRLQPIADKQERLKAIIDLLTHELPDSVGQLDYNKKYLSEIVIAESSKAYLTKDIAEINKDEVFKPYKDLCTRISEIISAYKPDYRFPRSLSTTLIETSHHQQFFSANLPRLTDNYPTEQKDFTYQFLEDLLFKTLA